jgi:hypothetical protein
VDNEAELEQSAFQERRLEGRGAQGDNCHDEGQRELGKPDLPTRS